MWCYCRLVYMPMSYLYGKRFVGPISPLILQLREEIYLQPYAEINWNRARHLCAQVWSVIVLSLNRNSQKTFHFFTQEDAYYPRPLVQNVIWDCLYMFAEPFLTCWPLNKLLREKALDVAMKHIHYEDENSRYITIGCVEKVKQIQSTQRLFIQVTWKPLFFLYQGIMHACVLGWKP